MLEALPVVSVLVVPVHMASFPVNTETVRYPSNFGAHYEFSLVLLLRSSVCHIYLVNGDWFGCLYLIDWVRLGYMITGLYVNGA